MLSNLQQKLIEIAFLSHLFVIFKIKNGSHCTQFQNTCPLAYLHYKHSLILYKSVRRSERFSTYKANWFGKCGKFEFVRLNKSDCYSFYIFFFGAMRTPRKLHKISQSDIRIHFKEYGLWGAVYGLQDPQN